MTRHLDLPTEEARKLLQRSQSEDKLQESIVKALRTLGYLVLITSRRVKKCRHCGKFPGGGQASDGASKGLGDLFVRARNWPAWLWVALEVKKAGPVKYSSPEQKVFCECDDIRVVQSIEEALVAVNAAKAVLDNCRGIVVGYKHDRP